MVSVLRYDEFEDAVSLANNTDSGLGVEYGIEGLSQYVTYKSIHRRIC